MFALWKRYRHAAAVAPLMLAMVATASAQAPYPNRNITLVLPFAAGSGTDTTTRIISKELGTALGVSMVIDNKPGANGSIAASYVARSAPDGYTLFVTTNTTHSANPYLLKNMTYDPVKDFTPIARTGDLPFMLVIHPDIPANSVAELIALAKKEPGKYSYASGSSSAIVSGATFARLAGIDLLARSLQELAAGADRRDRRPRLHDVHRRPDRPAPRQRQGAEGACGHDQAALGAAAASADHGRHGEGFRHHLMAGLFRPGQHAEGCRHQAERGNPQGGRAA